MRILLFSDSENIYRVTNSIIDGQFNLERCNYADLWKNSFPPADVVIMHFDEERIKNGTFEPIVKVKGNLGHKVPILAIIEGGTLQDIFSLLNVGADDYIENIDKTQEYREKIEQIVLWAWYLEKYVHKRE